MPGPTSPRSTPTAPPPTPRPSSSPRRRRPRSRPDMVSAAALGIRLAPGGQAVPGACLRLDPRAAPTFAVPAQGIVVDGERTRHPGLPAALRVGIVSRAAGRARAGNARAAPHPRRPLDETVVRSADRRRGCHRLPGTPSLTAGELLTPRNARILLGLGLAASGALLLAWQSHLTFLIDDWDLLLSRRGFNAHALLDPHARHLILGPALVYKAIQATLGWTRSFPTRSPRSPPSSPACSSSSST